VDVVGAYTQATAEVAEAKEARAAAAEATAAHTAAAATARRDALASRQAAREADRARDRLEVEQVKTDKKIAAAKVGSRARREGTRRRELFRRALRLRLGGSVGHTTDVQLQIRRRLLRGCNTMLTRRARDVGGVGFRRQRVRRTARANGCRRRRRRWPKKAPVPRWGGGLEGRARAGWDSLVLRCFGDAHDAHTKSAGWGGGGGAAGGGGGGGP
jgi:hypothetical protein